jgi:zinc protease
MLLHNIAEKTLGNGLKIICLEKTGTPVVAVQVWYKTGSVAEEKGIRGISHFLEHMMFRGSLNVKSEEHARRISDVGGHSNAFTAEDVTAYINSVPHDYLDLALSLEADRMDGLLLDERLLETEKRVIIEEFHTYMNNPVAKAFLEFRREFYGTHPYAISPLGLLDDIAAVSADKCRDYYRRHYAPDNAVIVVVGEVKNDVVFEAAARHFAAKPRRLAVPPRVDAAKPYAEGELRMKRRVEFDVPLLVTGYPAPPSSHEDAVALEILQLVTAGGETSRLHREVVRKKSIAVMAGGMNHLLKSSGMSIFFAAFTPDIGAGRVEKAIDREISRIKKDGITTEEMEKARNATLTNRTFELYSVDNICQRIGYSEVIEGNYRLWVERLESLRKLDTDRLVQVANRWWDDSKKHVLFLKPRRSNPLLLVAGIARRIMGLGKRFNTRAAKADG